MVKNMEDKHQGNNSNDSLFADDLEETLYELLGFN